MRNLHSTATNADAMPQSRTMSMIEVGTGNVVGLAIAVFVNWLMLPMSGHKAAGL